MTPKMKGHKHDREAADRKERIQGLMAKMPTMLDEYRVSSTALLLALVLVAHSQANLAASSCLATACLRPRDCPWSWAHAMLPMAKARGRADAEGAATLHWEECLKMRHGHTSQKVVTLIQASRLHWLQLTISSPSTEALGC
eukprot:SM001805S03746  [mRNA]  locus=s1805:235:767:+ [translate_table: standard]